MSIELTDTIDLALERLRGGQPIPVVLAYYPAQAEALVPLLEAAAALEALQPVEMPSPEVLVADRNEFLAKIAPLQREAVSPGPLVRLKEWIAHQYPWPKPGLTLQPKEGRRMSAILVKASLILSLVFGSAGGAAALAANSLPDSPLYPAKLVMEQVQLNVTSDPADQAALHLSLAQVRAQEMQRLALKGELPDEATLLRLQVHLNQAFRLAAQLPDDGMLALMTQAQHMIQTQEQELRQTQARAAEPAQEPLGQVSRILNQARQEVEAGLQDPQAFRWRHTENRPPSAPPQPTAEPMPGGNPDCPSGDCEPRGDQPGPGEPAGVSDCPSGDCGPMGDRHRYRPQLPTPAGSGASGGVPGSTCTDCKPAGDQNQYGPQPEEAPGPGMPGGNPDSPCTDCEPAGDQNQYGPQPEEAPGPGMPGGNPDSPCTDCEPAGDQNQHGGQPEEPSGSDEPGGDHDGSCTDCEPEGDQNQHAGDQAGQGGGKKH